MTEAGRSGPRYCDLVMKGGITSGLVYPRAVIEIGREYRFKSIGGTSAGAIAAALSAAAALGERRKAHGSVLGGLARLENTATQLSTPGKIFSLFQPIPKLRRAFRLLVALSSKPAKPVVAWLVISRSVVMAPFSFGLTLAALCGVAWLIGGTRGILAAAPPTFALSLAIAAYRAASGTAERLRSNLLGMCPGATQPGSAEPALSDWMHAEIRALAGLGEENGPPVTFGDLWSAPAYPDEAPAIDGERVLSLEVITTDVSHSEPRTLPFSKGTLWYRKSDMAKLFPAEVVDAMLAADPTVLIHGDDTYQRMPDGERLPIVVAARMSLSFPLLICAVPLYEQHFLRRSAASGPAATAADGAEVGPALGEATEELTSVATPGQGGAAFEMRVCWFTDGGVSSNFPLHLFDAPMPRWPTFAIDLAYRAEGQPPSDSPVFLPSGNNQGWRPRYNQITRDGGLQSVGAFIFGIVSTMQNWRDLLQGRAPGHRDRVVQVEVAPSEGGMNLNMPAATLQSLAGKGELAGQALRAFDFENHFWVRYRNFQASMERYGKGLHVALQAPPSAAETAYARAVDGQGKGGPYPFKAAQATEAAGRLNRLVAEIELWEDWDGSLTEGAPNPSPILRITPIF